MYIFWPENDGGCKTAEFFFSESDGRNEARKYFRQIYKGMEYPQLLMVN
jgi:hypothetical protein